MKLRHPAWPRGCGSARRATRSPRRRNSACFRTRDLRNHTVEGDKTLYFDVSGRSVYRCDDQRRLPGAA